MTKFGIKILSHENWLSQDPLMRNLIMCQHNRISVMSTEDWVVSILASKLSESVPQEIQKLFEVARGSMLYGYFFYPLFTLAFEQLLRVAETAISKKCNQITVEKIGNNRFIDKLNYLRKATILSDKEFSDWNRFRELRNMTSHPNQQTILSPGIILKLVSEISELINALYAPKSSSTNSMGTITY